MKIGDRVQIVSVPKCYASDLGRKGILKGYWGTDTFGGKVAEVLLDGEDGVTAIYESQLVLA